MNKAVIALPVGLALLIAAALFVRRAPAPASGAKSPRTERAPAAPPVVPAADPLPTTPPASSAPVETAIHEIKTELGVALNLLRNAKRQVEVLARATDAGKTLGERLQSQTAEFANLRLGAVVERLPAALSGLPREKADATATTLSAIQGAIGDLELQAQQLLTTISGLRQRPGFESDRGLAAAEANVAALQAMASVAVGRVTSEIAMLRER